MITSIIYRNALPSPVLEKSPLTIDDWLLTEAVRIQEETAGRRGDDEAANRVARSTGDGPTTRLVARARALPGAAEARADITRLRRLLGRCFAALISIGALAGLIAARGVAGGREIDFLLTSLVLVGLPSLMLALWAIALILTARGRGMSGRLAIAASTRLGRHMLSSPSGGMIIRAAGSLLTGPLGRWHLSTLSHGIWLAYALGAWLGLVVLFSLVQYELSWGTTLLGEDQVVRIIAALGAPIHALGLMPSPDADWIAAGREGVDLGSMRADWARFLLGIVLVYAALPRLLLLLLCLFLTRRAAGRLQLDTQAPGYLRLMPLIRPDAAQPGPAGREIPDQDQRPLRQLGAARGQPVLVGIELERADGDWPPALGGLALTDLGQADGRARYRELEAALDAMPSRPRAVIAVCSLKRTPDGGTAQRLNQLADAAGGALVLILTDRDDLAGRGIEPGQRIEDWHQLARRCGGQALVMDPDRPDNATLSRLRRWLEPAP
ncbi:MAG: DUF2868 domain-containing protein [Wenzhouxiangella sp.]|nr:MAG: DUF2868 domain-containing protein [Wenzhouxiangella sp.]